jgi:flagellar protein FliO/FliZ
MTAGAQSLKSLWLSVSVWLLVYTPYSHGLADDAKPLEMFDTAYLIQVFGSLLLVFGCLFGLVFFLKKINGLPTTDRKLIQVLGSVKVGSREKIVLLRAGEEQLLVGVAAGSVRTLHVFSDLGSEGLAGSGDTGANFAAVLKSSGQTGVKA